MNPSKAFPSTTTAAHMESITATVTATDTVNDGRPVWNKKTCYTSNRDGILFATYAEMAKSEKFQEQVRKGEITGDSVWTSAQRPAGEQYWESEDVVSAKWLDYYNKHSEFLALYKTDLKSKFVGITPGVRRVFVAGLGSMFHKNDDTDNNIRQHMLVYKICEMVAAAAQEQEEGKQLPKLSIYFEDTLYCDRDHIFIKTMFPDFDVTVNTKGDSWFAFCQNAGFLFIALGSTNPYREKMADFIETERASLQQPKNPVAVICREKPVGRDHSNSRVEEWLKAYASKQEIESTKAPIEGQTVLHY